jgi:drug/metabolite transporter (DMT)-like permease
VASRSRLSELALVGLAACAFAASTPIAKSIVGLSFAGIAAGRCAVAAAALLAIGPCATGRAVRALDGRTRLALVAAGVLLGAHLTLFLAGLQATSLPAAAALVSLEPVAVVLTAWGAFGIRPSRRELGGVALATLGAALVACGAGEGEHRLAGDALVLGSVALFGLYVAFARGLRDAMATTPYAASVYTVAALAVAPLVLVFDARASCPSAATWLAVVALGLVPTLLGHTLVQRAARHLPPSLVALVSPGETVGAILIGAATSHAPTRIEWAGAALVVAGAAVTVTGAKM